MASVENQQQKNETPWFESNLLWGSGALACTILLSVVTAVKHDLRWLLWFSLPCFAVAIWWIARRTREVWIVTVLGTVIVGCGLLRLSNWLRPEQQRPESKTQKSQATGQSTPSTAAAASTSTTQPQTAKPTRHKPMSLVGSSPQQTITPAPALPQQTVNAPNGIGTIGGTLINPQVNNYGYIQKTLSADQLERISLSMKPFADGNNRTDLITCQLGNADSCAIADQLVSAFRNAGWILEGYNQVVRSPEVPKSVSIAVKGGSSLRIDKRGIILNEGLPAGVLELSAALSESGLSVALIRDVTVPASQFRIMVGKKP